MSEKALNDLFLAQLKDIYFAEKQIYKTLPKMGKATRLPELKEASGLGDAGQAVEHYEMARYGALIAWAKQLNMPKATALLNETLQEEVKADKLLTQIGATEADKKAA